MDQKKGRNNMIDIHSHIIPGVDDGSKNIKMTIEMLKNAELQGTNEIIATPHFCRGYAEVEYSDIVNLTKKINKLAEDEGINVKIHHGQEVYYSGHLIEDYKENIVGTLTNTNYLLFELPLQGHFEREILDTIYELQVMGVKPILAYPERYKFLKEKPELINEFIEEEVLFQMNAGSIKGDFGKEAKKTAEIFAKNGIYNFIGSDAHNNTSRKTGVKEGTTLAASKNKIYNNLFDDSAERLLENKIVRFKGDKIKVRRGFRFFR